MITRIVKVKIMQEHRESFRHFMPVFVCGVRNFRNNYHADCFPDLDEKNHFHIYTIWKTEGALNKFIKSDLNLGFLDKIREWQSSPFSAWTVDNI